MVVVDNRLVDDLSLRDREYEIDDFVRYLERHHHGEKPGLSRERIDAYADALDYDKDRTNALLEERLMDSETWMPGNNLYRVEGNVSIYPPSWHEQLDDTIDLVEYVRVMLAEKEAKTGRLNPAQRGVPQPDMLTAIEIFADLDREMGEQLLQKQRQEGSIVIFASQNPEDLVRLPEMTE
ncbi:hypothetical protein NKF26_07410 [Haladaptatus sp. AB618]|uniref:hypothetical protein n=1 Tax=Haladaptatus sp. AB618 TaxID=2934173 RepID=UPI00209C0D33|nr:hypothetical protein [Haladaptatus sp. AB618]MCO8253626.1 hypothetical protein [Haladaptatus sp. AB618]